MSVILPYIILGLTSGSVYGMAGVGLVVTYKTSGVLISRSVRSARWAPTSSIS